jgi:glycosyltransferase involved in cell wall biosynthesis
MMNFSVVIPLYNKAAYILRAVNSVLNQTFQDFEIIVVDDGSTDWGGQIVKNIPDPRIRYIYQNNSGVSAARNRGIEEANSELIAFLDADDEWKNNCLDFFKELVIRYPTCDLFAQSYQVRKSSGKTYCPKFNISYPLFWNGILIDYLEAAKGIPPFCSSSVCIRKSILQKENRFPEGISMGEDLSLWLTLSLRYNIAYYHSLSVTYNQDLSERACITNQVEYGYFEELIINHLQKLDPKSNFYRNLFEYYNYRLLTISSIYLSKGENRKSNILLQKCKGTTKYKSRWKRQWLLSLLPNIITRNYYLLLQRIQTIKI